MNDTKKQDKFTRADAQRLKEKGASVKWRSGKREEYYALFSMDEISETHRKALEKEGIRAFDLNMVI